MDCSPIMSSRAIFNKKNQENISKYWSVFIMDGYRSRKSLVIISFKVEIQIKK
ncbi:MAG: hypothetical protein ACI8RD_010391 [Bacillariaceae sp.]|jgi:hypothetical protein